MTDSFITKTTDSINNILQNPSGFISRSNLNPDSKDL